MPENKLQHYVPRCHLRPFTEEGAGAAINLFNLDRRVPIRGAPAKGQCARTYFYGDDLVVEKSLQVPEGFYAASVAKAIKAPHSLTKADLAVIRMFLVLQTRRSFGTVEKTLELLKRQYDEIFVASGVEIREPPPDLRIATSVSLSGLTTAVEAARDLECCVVVNASRIKFVTSDDPAVQTNRFYHQRLRDDAFGISNSGAMLFLPLTPTLLFMAYDANVYFVPNRSGHIVSVSHDRDVEDLNQLQFLHARHNIYFSDWEQREKVSSGFQAYAERRPEIWNRIIYLKKIAEDEFRETYVPLAEGETAGTEANMIHTQEIHVKPQRWPTVLAFRPKIVAINTGTGRGHARPSR